MSYVDSTIEFKVEVPTHFTSFEQAEAYLRAKFFNDAVLVIVTSLGFEKTAIPERRGRNYAEVRIEATNRDPR